MTSKGQFSIVNYVHLLEHNSHNLDANWEVWQLSGCPKYFTGSRHCWKTDGTIGKHMLEDYNYYGLEQNNYTKKAFQWKVRTCRNDESQNVWPVYCVTHYTP